MVRECAAMAGIDDEIMAMPMNYNTLVGDMGTALSGGQRQRLLLARALYRRPRILFMDEGTSNLDVDKERQVNRALAALRHHPRRHRPSPRNDPGGRPDDRAGGGRVAPGAELVTREARVPKAQSGRPEAAKNPGEK